MYSNRTEAVVQAAQLSNDVLQLREAKVSLGGLEGSVYAPSPTAAPSKIEPGDYLAEFDACLDEPLPAVEGRAAEALQDDCTGQTSDPAKLIEDLAASRASARLPHHGRMSSPLFSSGEASKQNIPIKPLPPNSQPSNPMPYPTISALHHSLPSTYVPQLQYVPPPMAPPFYPAVQNTQMSNYPFSFHPTQVPAVYPFRPFYQAPFNIGTATIPSSSYYTSSMAQQFQAMQQPQAINAARFLVSGISDGVTEFMLQQLFSLYGHVRSVLLTRKDGRTTGTGKVVMTCFQDPSVCRQALHGQLLGPGRLTVMEFMIDIQNRTEAREILQARKGFEAPNAVPPTSLGDHAAQEVLRPHHSQLNDPISKPQRIEKSLIDLESDPDISLLDLGDDETCTFPTLQHAVLPPSPLLSSPLDESGYSSAASRTSSSPFQDADLDTKSSVIISAEHMSTRQVEKLPASPSSSPSEQAEQSVRAAYTSQDGGDTSEEVQKLRTGLERLAITPLQADKQAILGLLMMLPEKQRRLCIYNPAYMRAIAFAAMRMLEAVPAEEEQTLFEL